MAAPPTNAGAAALARGWMDALHLAAAGHSIDPYKDLSAGGHWAANPYVASV